MSRIRYCFFYILLILFFACTSKQKSLEDYQKTPIAFEKQKVEYPNGDFSILIPKNWQWRVSYNEWENFILGIEAVSNQDVNGNVNTIWIQKTLSNSGEKDLKSEYEFMFKNINDNSNMGKIIETGKIDISNNQSYFISNKLINDDENDFESVLIITNSEMEGVFYYIDLTISQTKDLQTKKAILVQCLTSFHHN